MEIEFEFLNLFILLVCLYIIRDIINQLKDSKGKATSAILFLQSGIFIDSLRVIMFAVTLWAIKDGLFILDESMHLGLGDILRGIGIAVAIVMSYGLYLVIVPFRRIKKK